MSDIVSERFARTKLFSLTVEFHDIVVRNTAHRTLLASTCTLNTSCDMTTWYESCIALILIANLAHFRLGTRGDSRLLGCLGGRTNHVNLMIWWTYWQMSLISFVLMQMMFERLFQFLLIFDKHELSINIDFIANLTWNSHELHLLALKILVPTGKLLAILSSLVDNWHVF